MTTFEEDEYYMEGGADSDQEIIDDVVDENESDDENNNVEETNENNDDSEDENNINAVESESENGDVDGDEDNDEDDEDDEDDEENQNNATVYQQENESSDEDNESEYSSDEEYNTKVDDEYRYNLMKRVHPEEFNEDYTYIKPLLDINRNKDNIIIDKNHKTLPILTKYEKARILGLRISQLNKGAEPFIDNKERQIVDTHIIAEEELKTKALPFIIMRPIPNGKKEYWSLQDLEIIEN